MGIVKQDLIIICDRCGATWTGKESELVRDKEAENYFIFDLSHPEGWCCTGGYPEPSFLCPQCYENRKLLGEYFEQTRERWEKNLINIWERRVVTSDGISDSYEIEERFPDEL